jgi:hypothetical protein
MTSTLWLASHPYSIVPRLLRRSQSGTMNFELNLIKEITLYN